MVWLLGSSALALPECNPDVLDEHTAIVDAIEASDPVVAADAIRHHAKTATSAAAKKAGLTVKVQTSAR